MKKFSLFLLCAAVASTVSGCRCLFGTVNNEDVLACGLKSDAYWTAIHAAEYLVDLGIGKDKVADFIACKSPAHSVVPAERIGLWRVTALNYAGTDRGKEAIENIRKVAFHPEKIEDRVHAVETLFKLGVKLNADEIKWMKNYCENFEAPDNGRVYAAALLMHSDMKLGVDLMKKFYHKDMERRVMLFCFKYFNDLPEDALLMVKDIRRDPAYDDNMRMIAVSVLLNNKQMDFASASAAAAKLDTDGSEYVRMAVAHKKDAILSACEKLCCFSNAEHRILSAWAKAHIQKEFKK